MDLLVSIVIIMQRPVNPPIQHVTVYPDCALVRRQGNIQLTGEERSLVISQLPEHLQADSIRVAGNGPTEVALLGVQCWRQTQPKPQSDPPLVGELHAQETEKQQFQARRQALQLQRRFLQNLSEQAVEPFAQTLAQQQVSLAKTQQFMAFLESQYLSLDAAIAALDGQAQQCDRRIADLRSQLQQVYDQQPRPHCQLRLDINPLGAGDWVLDLTYLVPGASWQPVYDLRWDSGHAKLNLSALAQVQQTTGEDWLNVKLAFSTAPPQLGPLPTAPEPWYIDLPPNPFVHIRYSRERYQAASAEMESAGALPVAAEELETFPAAEPAPLTYEALGENTIASEAEPHGAETQSPQLVTLRNLELPVDWRALAMPRLQAWPELEVTLQNPPTGLCWLPGVANLFRDGAYLGQVTLPLLLPETQVPLRFGPDRNLRIQRQISDRKLDTNLRGNRHRLNCTYAIEIQNLAAHEQTVQLIEQLPVSRNEKLKVQLLRTQPKQEPDEAGNLVWVLPVAARSQQVVSYQFTVDYPADMPVNGLNL